MNNKMLATILTAALIAGACSGDDDDEPATAEDSVADEPTTTTEDSMADEPPIITELRDTTAFMEAGGPDPNCWYKRGQIITSGTVRDLEDAGFEGVPVGGRELTYRIPDDLDPLVAAHVLVSRGIEAAPVLMMTHAGHWGYAPGTEPSDTGRAVAGYWADASDPLSDGHRRVAVVDTGFLQLEQLPWNDDRIRPVDDSGDHIEDIDPKTPQARKLDLYGHGMFVASLILKQQPQTEVVIARVPNVELDRFAAPAEWPTQDVWNALGVPSEAIVTDELAMFHAVEQLASSERNDFDVLNVSMGAYECRTLESGLAIKAAMRLWQDEVGSPVVAAAGNHDPAGQSDAEADATDDHLHDPELSGFLPAGLGNRVDPQDLRDAGYPPILAIAATDDSGRRTDYSNDGEFEVEGDNLIGTRDGVRLVAWGGTSFATAIAAAAVAHREPSADPRDSVRNLTVEVEVHPA